MIWSIAVTVRLPGARTAPVSRTFTCCQTDREKTGAKTPMALLKALGKESMAILSGRREHEVHCRSILTQMAINGQSRAQLEVVLENNNGSLTRLLAEGLPLFRALPESLS